jgi:hypothetical protein
MFVILNEIFDQNLLAIILLQTTVNKLNINKQLKSKSKL